MKAREALERAKAGRLSAIEVDDLAETLRRGQSEEDYTLLHALGLAGAKRHRDLVERYLVAVSDPMMTRLALQVLCSYWGEAERYLPYVERFVTGTAEDPDGDVRLAAISIAGEHLRHNLVRPLLQQILSLFRDENQEQIVRESAYFALARAMGANWEELPSAAKHFDLREVDAGVLQRVESVLRE